MRIIGGTHKGIRLNPPTGLPSRPTTDRAKEALFNILVNQLDFDGLHALDLYTGTGNIALELASRGVASVLAIDTSFKCCVFIKEIAKKHRLETVKVIKEDALKYIKRSDQVFDFIFADPPFQYLGVPTLAHLIFENGLVKPGGTLIIEHPAEFKMDPHPAFLQQRDYGFAGFSFYKAPEE